MPEGRKARGKVQVLRFPETLGPSQIVRMKGRLTRLLDRHPRLLFLDLGATRRVNLAGLGMLLDRLRRGGNSIPSFRFLNASPGVQRILERAGLNGFLGD